MAGAAYRFAWQTELRGPQSGSALGSPGVTRHTVLLFPGFGSSGREVLGLGTALSAGGVNVVIFAPRGWHESEGEFTGTGAIEDACRRSGSFSMALRTML